MTSSFISLTCKCVISNTCSQGFFLHVNLSEISKAGQFDPYHNRRVQHSHKFQMHTASSLEKVFLSLIFAPPIVYHTTENNTGGTWREGVEEDSVLVNPKDPHAVQLRELGDEHAEQRGRVYQEVRCVVFGVETRQEITVEQNNNKINSKQAVQM